MSNYCAIQDVKDILHSLRDKFNIDSGSSVSSSGIINEVEIERWIMRAMMKIHSWVRKYINPDVTLPITPLSSVPEEMQIATQFLTASMIRTMALGGHRMATELDSAVSEWMKIVKQCMDDLLESLKEGYYYSLTDSNLDKIFLSYSATPQWCSQEAFITEMLGITDVGPGRIGDVDNTEIGLRGDDIWDTVFEEESGE